MLDVIHLGPRRTNIKSGGYSDNIRHTKPTEKGKNSDDGS